jgi:hypothetical protein
MLILTEQNRSRAENKDLMVNLGALDFSNIIDASLCNFFFHIDRDAQLRGWYISHGFSFYLNEVARKITNSS